MSIGNEFFDGHFISARMPPLCSVCNGSGEVPDPQLDFRVIPCGRCGGRGYEPKDGGA